MEYDVEYFSGNGHHLMSNSANQSPAIVIRAKAIGGWVVDQLALTPRPEGANGPEFYCMIIFRR